MKALSVREPWASLIVDGFKPVENRTWRTKHRGVILIHATHGTFKAFEENRRKVEAINADAALSLPKSTPYMGGAIIGSAVLVDIVERSDSRWHEPGCLGWLLGDAKRFDKPIPMPGALGLWEVTL